MNVYLLASVAAGGAIGASLRYMSALAAIRIFGPGFPWGTLFVNVLGSFLMGAAFEYLAERVEPHGMVQLFLMTGILGGFTTFSAFSLEIVTLFSNKDYFSAILYAAGSVLLSLVAMLAGLYIMRTNLT